jgi:hypothetical protein
MSGHSLRAHRVRLPAYAIRLCVSKNNGFGAIYVNDRLDTLDAGLPQLLPFQPPLYGDGVHVSHLSELLDADFGVLGEKGLQVLLDWSWLFDCVVVTQWPLSLTPFRGVHP